MALTFLSLEEVRSSGVTCECGGWSVNSPLAQDSLGKPDSGTCSQPCRKQMPGTGGCGIPKAATDPFLPIRLNHMPGQIPSGPRYVRGGPTGRKSLMDGLMSKQVRSRKRVNSRPPGFGFVMRSLLMSVLKEG
jgi:hypothetical protein